MNARVILEGSDHRWFVAKQYGCSNACVGWRELLMHRLCPSNAYVQATLGVGSVSYCTIDLGSACFEHGFVFLPCDTLGLSWMMSIFWHL